jgi:hypothetical protein
VRRELPLLVTFKERIGKLADPVVDAQEPNRPRDVLTFTFTFTSFFRSKPCVERSDAFGLNKLAISSSPTQMCSTVLFSRSLAQGLAP